MDDVPISQLDDEQLLARLTELSAHITAAQARFVALVAEVDRRGLGPEWGMRDTGALLDWQCGLSVTEARRQVEVARALESLPVTREAFESGRLSYSKARAICRMATPDTEDALVGLAAGATATHMDRLASAYVRARKLDEDEVKPLHERAFLEICPRGDGLASVRGLVPSDDGEQMAKILREVADDIYRERKDVGLSPDVDPPGGRQVEALIRIFEGYARGWEVDHPASDRFHVGVNVDLDVLLGGDGVCELEERGVGIAAETARRLMCDASVQGFVVDGQGNPLDAGRRRRTATRAMRKAMRRRDRHCVVPGCNATLFLQAHHIRFWTRGGTTSTDQMRLICRAHHHLVHEGGYRLYLDGTQVYLRSPKGWWIGGAPPSAAGDVGAVVDANRRRGLDIDPSTAVPDWDGTHLSLPDIVSHLRLADAARRLAARFADGLPDGVAPAVA